MAATLTFTSYTCVTFANSESSSDVKIVQTWPGGSVGNNSADQVPTKIEYTHSKTTWGYEVPDGGSTPGSKPLKWFKLLLQEREAAESVPKNHANRTGWQHGENSDAALSAVDARFARLGITPTSLWASVFNPSVVTPEQRTKRILQELNITPVEVVADFLANIREITLASIKRTYWMEGALGSKVEWILTVPAIWTDAAKNLMIQAARQAGFGERGMDFELISEPECGATYSLNAIQPHDLSVCSSPPRSLSSDG